jgi:hypothetical protein
MKYAVEMGSGVMIHIPSFIKIGLPIQLLMRGTHTQSARRPRRPTFIFQDNECRLKRNGLQMYTVAQYSIMIS